jgi:hypothetical protein
LPIKYYPERLFLISLKKLSLKKTSVFYGWPKQKKKKKIGTIFWEQTFRFVPPKDPFKFREALRSTTKAKFSSFSGPKRAFPKSGKFPRKKLQFFPAGQKIGTIFCPKGGLAVVTLNP